MFASSESRETALTVRPTLCSSTARLSTIGNDRNFKCGRQKQRLGLLTKIDPYLNSLLVLGVRAELAAAKSE